MVKKDFVKLYAETYGTDEATAKQNIENVINLVLVAVKEEKCLKFNNFGTFEIRETKERKIVDPKREGNIIHAKPRKYIKFRGSRTIEKTF